MTASKEKLVVLLYEAGIRELGRAATLLQEGQARSQIGESLGKAFSLVSELKAALNIKEGGEIATNLDQLYTFIQGRISTANRERVAEPVLEAKKVMLELKEGWDGILRSA